MGTGVERTHVAMAGLRLAECGTNGAGSPTTSRPCNPTFAQKTERAGLGVAAGQAEQWVAPCSPTFKHR